MLTAKLMKFCPSVKTINIRKAETNIPNTVTTLTPKSLPRLYSCKLISVKTSKIATNAYAIICKTVINDELDGTTK